MTETTSNAPALRRSGGALVPGLGNVVNGARVFYAQPAVRRAFPMVAVAVVILSGLLLYISLQVPQRTTLFASLPEAEKARVIEALRNAGTDVQVDPTTGELTVPVADYHSARMSLAAQGLPTSLPDGYSVLTEMPMGTSRSVEAMRLKQSQEVELARSINQIDVVAAARVHLAIPERSAFARNAQEPTASVFLQLKPGRTLAADQVAAIVNLVSASVPNLPRSGVTVVDQNGRLLSSTLDDPATTQADRQLEYRLRLEGIYRSRIEELLTPIVGPGNVSAQVSIDIDFTQRAVTEDLILPDAAAVISEQMSMEEEQMRPAGGIPGAVANTVPPVAELGAGGPAATAAAEGSEAAGEGADAAAADAAALEEGSGQPFVRSSSNVRNYEVSRKVASETAPNANLRRVTVAVLLREPPPLPSEDGELVGRGFGEAELAEIRALVETATGFQESRGDTIRLTSKPFISPEEVISEMSAGIEPAWHEDPWVRETIRNVLMVAVLAIVTLGLVKPLLSRLLVPAGAGVGAGTPTLDADGEPIDMGTIEVEEGQTLEEIKAKLKPKKSTISVEMLDTANSYDDKVALIRMIVADEAGRVSNVFKAMMQDELDQVN